MLVLVLPDSAAASASGNLEKVALPRQLLGLRPMQPLCELLEFRVPSRLLGLALLMAVLEGLLKRQHRVLQRRYFWCIVGIDRNKRCSW